MRNQYILLYRSLLNHPLWQMKPFSPGQCWVDIIARANSRQKTFEGITIQRGQLCESQRTYAERWGWDRKKVKRFLEYLQKERMITLEGNNRTSLITVLNYDEFQSVDTKNGATNDPTNGATDFASNILEFKKFLEDEEENGATNGATNDAQLNNIYIYKGTDLRFWEPDEQTLQFAKRQGVAVNEELIESFRLKLLDWCDNGRIKTIKIRSLFLTHCRGEVNQARSPWQPPPPGKAGYHKMSDRSLVREAEKVGVKTHGLQRDQIIARLEAVNKQGGELSNV